MNIRILILLSLFLFVNQQFTYSQPGQPELSTTSKKAKKFYEAATDAFQKYDYADVFSKLEKAIKEDPNFYEAYLLMGEMYAERNKAQDAINAYLKAIKINPNCFPPVYYNLGSFEFQLGKYRDANEHLKKYLTTDKIPEGLKEKAEFKIKCCDFAINAMKNPVVFKPINLGSEINTKEREYYPCITVDDKTLLFTRHIYPENLGNVGQEDFFITNFEDDKWTNSKNLGAPINTSWNEGAPTLAPDGKTIVFTSCEVHGNYGNYRKGYGSCDLFFSQKIGNKWSQPVNLGYLINTNQWESQPSLGSDGRTLYYIRGIVTKDGPKHQDIYVTKYISEGKWSNPQKLSEKINTAGVEESVHIHPDGRTLYFSSNGHPGMGGLDIFMSRMDDNGEWSEPVNLGYPINTHNDENSLLVSGDGNIAFIASDREGGYGLLDLYSFDLPEQFRPSPLTYLKGIVYDANTKSKLEAKFELIDLESEKVISESYSDKVKGDFLISIPSNKNYALNVSKDGYLFYSDNFSLKGQFSELEPYLKNIPLQPISSDSAVIELKNIFFETAKYDLKPESNIELNKLVSWLNKNPRIKIEILGHTDNVGDDEDNLILSDNRAKSVYNYLVEHKIAAERLSWKGFGETMPKDTNETEKGRANNRRTEFRIVRR